MTNYGVGMQKRWLCWIGAAFCWLGSLHPACAEEYQRGFASADEAVNALVTALREHNEADWRAILGPEAGHLIDLKGPSADQQQLDEFLALYDEKHAIDQKAMGHAELYVGPNDWPLPIPIVESHGRWTFDTSAGTQSIIDRRIGRNELAAIRTLLACADAQQEYLHLSELTTGTGVYATRLVSTPGHRDGLYWPAATDGTESPLGRLIFGAEEAGFPGELHEDKPVQYEGYYFRILKAQGPNAEGGAKSYVDSGQMIGGFGLIAWPVEFNSSGIMSFIVGPNRIVYQKDLGLNTLSVAATSTIFDPDLTWSRIELTHD